MLAAVLMPNLQNSFNIARLHCRTTIHRSALANPRPLLFHRPGYMAIAAWTRSAIIPDTNDNSANGELKLTHYRRRQDRQRHGGVRRQQDCFVCVAAAQG